MPHRWRRKLIPRSLTKPALKLGKARFGELPVHGFSEKDLIMFMCPVRPPVWVRYDFPPASAYFCWRNKTDPSSDLAWNVVQASGSFSPFDAQAWRRLPAAGKANYDAPLAFAS